MDSDYLHNDMQGGNGYALFEYPLYASTGEEFNKNAPKGDKSVAVGAGTGTSSSPSSGSTTRPASWRSPARSSPATAAARTTRGHTSNHDKFKGMATEKGLGKANFINFRGDYPNTYAAVQQDLGLGITGEHVKGQGWEVNDNAKMRVPWAPPAPSRCPPSRRARATPWRRASCTSTSRANWKVQGNLFDPYWHGKLHFFNRSELLKILALSGDTDSAAMAALAPVEGVD